jgi:hypothetical protein
VLIHDEHLSIRSRTDAQVHTRSRFLALLAILLLDELEQRLSYAIAEEQNAADGRLSTSGQIVGVEIKDLSAGQVAPQHAVGQLWDGASAVNENTGGRGPSLQERVAVVVLG